ncbi:uncharacterized protein A4U43_C03F2850 [Asparagus officinalis]|uniref:Uncharacterized protein n=1 Tax=Asparagus officinalis TaxID=4686 RepID=A0A5P1F6X1_ASPOF|nr:uncharacterized protein A4U43_C03F2850 [Asparagus officinalis]
MLLPLALLLSCFLCRGGANVAPPRKARARPAAADGAQIPQRPPPGRETTRQPPATTAGSPPPSARLVADFVAPSPPAPASLPLRVARGGPPTAKYPAGPTKIALVRLSSSTSPARSAKSLPPPGSSPSPPAGPTANSITAVLTSPDVPWDGFAMSRAGTTAPASRPPQKPASHTFGWNVVPNARA